MAFDGTKVIILLLWKLSSWLISILGGTSKSLEWKHVLFPKPGGTSTLVILKQLLTVGLLGFQLGTSAFLPGFEMIYTELAKFASSKMFIVGVVQILGALALDVKNYKIDVLVVNGHKWL